MSFQGLSSLLSGRRVTGFRRVLFVRPDGVRDEHYGPLEVTTEGHVTALLDIGSDLASVRWVVGPWHDPLAEPLSPENQEFVAKNGRWVSFDVSAEPGFADIVGRTILAVEELRPGADWPAPAPDGVIGARLVTQPQIIDAYASSTGGFVVKVAPPA